MKQLITATGAMVLLLALIIEIVGMGMMNLKLGALDTAVNEFVHITGEEGFIGEENERNLKEEVTKITGCSNDNIRIEGPREHEDEGKLMHISVEADIENVLRNKSFWKKIKDNDEITYRAERFVYSRYCEEEKEDEEKEDEEKEEEVLI